MTTPYDWIVPEWPAPARVRSLITTRNGGFSSGPCASFNLGCNNGDEERAVSANRSRLRALLPQEPKWLRQVHGTRAVIADGRTDIPEADAAIARETGTVCVVMIADCLPLLLCDDAGSAVAVAHAGWRGLSAGVIEATVCAMNVAPSRLIAYLGPAIGPDAFEVGSDVHDVFTAADPDAALAFRTVRAGKWLADLYLLARLRLARSGVRQVFGGGLCTYSDAMRFFSYRRDQVTGRMAALIWLASGKPADDTAT